MTQFADPTKIGSIDCLLLAGGSDHRAYEILRKCSDQKIPIRKIILFNFKERLDLAKAKDKYFDYKKITYTCFEFVECSIKNPESCRSDLAMKLSSFSNLSNLAIDISCFTKPYFFSLLSDKNRV